MKTCPADQGSQQWFMDRAGRPTASRFSDIITPKALRLSASADKYALRLAGERVFGIIEESPSSFWMERGLELEPKAREAYELMRGCQVVETGLCLSKCQSWGASPDGLINDDGLLEIKCPTFAVHLQYLVADAMPSDYMLQVQGQLFTTGREYCDFMSYYPGARSMIVRILPDEKVFEALATELPKFCDKIEEYVKILESK
jgi:hypothetical protein